MKKKKKPIKNRLFVRIACFVLALSLVLVNFAMPAFADSTSADANWRNIFSYQVDMCFQWDSSRTQDPTVTQFDSPVRWRSFHSPQWYYSKTSTAALTSLTVLGNNGVYPLRTSIAWDAVLSLYNTTFDGLIIDKTIPYPGSDPSEIAEASPVLYIQAPSGWFSTPSDPIESLVLSFPDLDPKYANSLNPGGGIVSNPLRVTGRALLWYVDENSELHSRGISSTRDYTWWTTSPLAFVAPFDLTHHFDSIIGIYGKDYLLTNVEFTCQFTDVLLDNIDKDSSVQFPLPVTMQLEGKAEYFRNVANYASRYFSAKGVKFTSFQPDADFNQLLEDGVGGFLEMQIIPGVSILGILLTVVGLSLTIAFIKFFAGG